VHLPVVFEARLLAEGLSAGAAHVGLLSRVDVLMMPQSLPRSKALWAVATREGLELQVDRPHVGLQLESSGEPPAAVRNTLI